LSAEASTAVSSLKRLQAIALPAAFVGAVLLGIGFQMDVDPGKKIFWSSYLYGFMVWFSLAIGSTTLIFLHHTIRAQWSLSILRVAEACAKTLPLLAVFFLPLVWAAWNGQVYPWANHDVYHHLHPNKQMWFSPTGWTVRSAIYFAYWIIGTNYLTKLSLKQDDNRDEAFAAKRTNFAAPGGVIHVVLLTFAMTDWVMSLDPMWLSSLYGAWHMATSLLFSIAVGSFILLSLRTKSPYSGVIQPQLTKDLGNLMLGFTMVYGYFTLSQFLIIWSGNLPEENIFFVQRFEGPMVYLGAALVVCQFVIPFLLLISGKTKRTPSILRFVAGWIAVVRIVDLFWQIVPFMVNFSGGVAVPVILGAIGAVLAVGGVWVYVFSGNARKVALIPSYDPRLIEAKQQWEASSHA
jgi:hypothetical protein